MLRPAGLKTKTVRIDPRKQRAYLSLHFDAHEEIVECLGVVAREISALAEAAKRQHDSLEIIFDVSREPSTPLPLPVSLCHSVYRFVEAIHSDVVSFTFAGVSRLPQLLVGRDVWFPCPAEGKRQASVVSYEWQHRRAEDVLFEVTTQIEEALLGGEPLDGVALDFAKCFDRVPQELVLKLVEDMGCQWRLVDAEGCCTNHHEEGDGLAVKMCTKHRMTACSTCKSVTACCRNSHHKCLTHKLPTCETCMRYEDLRSRRPGQCCTEHGQR
ncbi:hypothetical protein DIPPA_11789 [Diplonema papillatum]|nr:hypothetical protein DIPPA_11789 [Diplonema papillatum]